MNPQPGILARFRCNFGDFHLDVDLNLPGDGVTAVFGHSGCGKTTLLRCIAGLQTAQGHLHVNGEDWQSNAGSLPVHQRPLAYVFQNTALFPHLSVTQNLNFGYRRIAPAQRRITPEQAIAWLGLEHLLERRPANLSGGESQRVAIARALLTSPRLLLMDEPLSALDQNSKREIMPYLEGLRDNLSIPVIYVSHSMAEVSRLADHVVMMDKGRVTAQGPLGDTLARTDQHFSRDEDSCVILTATIGAQDTDWHLCRADFDGGHLWLRAEEGLETGSKVRIRVLARDVSLALSAHEDQSIQNLVPARIDAITGEISPGTTLVRLLAGRTPFLSRLTTRAVHRLGLTSGAQVWMQIKSVAIVD